MNFISQAFKGKNNWWRYTILLVLFLTPFLSKFIYTTFFTPLLSYFSDDISFRFAIKQCKYIVLLLVFLGLYKILHKREIKTLITNRKRFDFLRFWLGFCSWGVVLMLVFSVKVVIHPELYKWNFNLFPFLKLFFLTAIVSIFRVFFIVFFTNSYILQMFTVILKKNRIALIASVLFFVTLMSLQNRNLDGFSVVYYLALGLVLFFIITLDNGTELILGMLLASTLISRLFITYSTYKMQLNTVLIKEGGRDTFLLGVIIPVFCFPLFFFMLYKIYNWQIKIEN